MLQQSQLFKDCVELFATPFTALQARKLNASAGLSLAACFALPCQGEFADDFSCACPHPGEAKPAGRYHPTRRRDEWKERRARSGSSCFGAREGLSQDWIVCSLPVLPKSSHSWRLCSALLLWKISPWVFEPPNWFKLNVVSLSSFLCCQPQKYCAVAFGFCF